MLCHSEKLPDCEAINIALMAGFERYRNHESTRQSHHFGGRFENIYIDRTLVPEVEAVLAFAIEHTARLLDRSPDELRAGFWFNAMGPGHATLPHTHEENDELMSAVYYVQVPPDSGRLILYDDDDKRIVEPAEGLMALFPPSVEHEVEANCSGELRLSLGINVGPLASD